MPFLSGGYPPPVGPCSSTLIVSLQVASRADPMHTAPAFRGLLLFTTERAVHRKTHSTPSLGPFSVAKGPAASTLAGCPKGQVCRTCRSLGAQCLFRASGTSVEARNALSLCPQQALSVLRSPSHCWPATPVCLRIHSHTSQFPSLDTSCSLSGTVRRFSSCGHHTVVWSLLGRSHR